MSGEREVFDEELETIDNLQTTCDEYIDVLKKNKLDPLLKEYHRLTQGRFQDDKDEDLLNDIAQSNRIASSKWHYILGKNHDIVNCTNKIFKYLKEISNIHDLRATLNTSKPNSEKITNFKKKFKDWIEGMGSRLTWARESGQGKSAFAKAVRTELRTTEKEKILEQSFNRLRRM